jgi:hypothetical protein
MSWRDSDDPRCPECGEEISATATYCMHCYADLPTDGDADVSPADDVSFGQSEQHNQREAPDRGDVYGSGGETGRTSDAATAGTGMDTDTGDGAHPTKATGEDDTDGAFGPLPNPHSLDGLAGRVASMVFTDVPDADGIPESVVTAPLWMRAPVAFVAGLFAYLFFAIFLAILFNDLSFPGNWILFLGGFVGIMYWLGRKPLPSDIIGDACYGIALLLFVMPPTYFVNSLLRWVITGGEVSLETAAILTVFGAFLAYVPALVFMILGYAGNRYARSKLDSKAEQATERVGV